MLAHTAVSTCTATATTGTCSHTYGWCAVLCFFFIVTACIAVKPPSHGLGLLGLPVWSFPFRWRTVFRAPLPLHYLHTRQHSSEATWQRVHSLHTRQHGSGFFTHEATWQRVVQGGQDFGEAYKGMVVVLGLHSAKGLQRGEVSTRLKCVTLNLRLRYWLPKGLYSMVLAAKGPV